MNDMQPSPLTHTSEELKYLPEGIDTEKDHLLIERKGLRDFFFFLVQSDLFANVQTRWPSTRVMVNSWKTWYES